MASGTPKFLDIDNSEWMNEPYPVLRCIVLLYLVFCSSVILRLYQKSAKHHPVNNLGFAGHIVYVDMCQLLNSNSKATIDNSK